MITTPRSLTSRRSKAGLRSRLVVGGVWTFGWDAVVALGTLGLALFAFVQLVSFNRRERRREQPIAIARNAGGELGQMRVYLTNEGTGSAFNVRFGVKLNRREYAVLPCAAAATRGWRAVECRCRSEYGRGGGSRTVAERRREAGRPYSSGAALARSASEVLGGIGDGSQRLGARSELPVRCRCARRLLAVGGQALARRSGSWSAAHAVGEGGGLHDDHRHAHRCHWGPRSVDEVPDGGLDGAGSEGGG
jgi:hypothetical protein